MNAKNLLIGGAIVYFLSRGASAVATAVKNKIAVGSVKASNWEFNLLNGLSFDLKIDVINTNPVAIPVDAVTGNLFYNTTKLATVSNDQKQALQPNETVTYAFKVQKGILSIAQNLIGILTGGGKPSLKIRGSALVEGVPVPFEKNVINIG